MVEKIKETKDQVLGRMEKSINERGIDRIDVTEMGKLADIVKDLADAEKACMEAEYYMTVTDEMGKAGYTPDGMGYDSMGFPRGGSQGGGQGGNRGGGRSGYRDSRGRYARRGYGYEQDPLQGVRDAMSMGTPEEREKMARELRGMLGM